MLYKKHDSELFPSFSYNSGTKKKSTFRSSTLKLGYNIPPTIHTPHSTSSPKNTKHQTPPSALENFPPPGASRILSRLLCTPISPIFPRIIFQPKKLPLRFHSQLDTESPYTLKIYRALVHTHSPLSHRSSGLGKPDPSLAASLPTYVTHTITER